VHLTRVFRTTGFRLAALYTGLFGLSVLFLFGVIYWITSDALRQQLTANVEDSVAALVEDYQSGGLSHVVSAIETRTAAEPNATMFYLLLNPDGRKLAGNLVDPPPMIGWHDLPSPREPENGASDDPEDINDSSLLALGVLLPDRSFLMVGEDTFRVVEVEEAIVRALGWAFGITIVLGIAGGFAMSVGFLRSVDAINQTARAIIEGRLTDRVPTRGTGDELDSVALNLNEMLDRIQTLMESLRQVSSDIAHDLRTPLSHLRQRLEGVRLQARRIDDYEAAVDQAIIESDAILKTFSALLRIAQIEAGTRKTLFSTVDLSVVFQSIAEAYGAVAEDRGQTLTSAIVPGIHIRGDRELLTQMLANLVENAIRHTPERTQIKLILECQSAGPIGIVADEGPGIPAEAREKVFQRFFRLERSRSTPGNGLGLSLVAAVADIHEIAVTLTDNEPGLKVSLNFAPNKVARVHATRA
jgi:signal transduction histidine kinase